MLNTEDGTVSWRKMQHRDFLQPVLFLDGNTDYSAFAPKENVRIKMSGGGLTSSMAVSVCKKWLCRSLIITISERTAKLIRRTVQRLIWS